MRNSSGRRRISRMDHINRSISRRDGHGNGLGQVVAWACPADRSAGPCVLAESLLACMCSKTLA